MYNLTITDNDVLNYINEIKDTNGDINKLLNKFLYLGLKEYQKKELMPDNIIIQQLDEKFENLKYMINEIKLENVNSKLMLNTNTNRGIIGECLVYNYFKDRNYEIEMCSDKSHSGDLLLKLEEINKNVLIEIKNYKYTVDQKQIDKFYYDLDHTGIELGIFVSLNSKIVNIKYPVEWKILQSNKIVVFISECKEEYLNLAIYSLLLLYKNNNYTSNIKLIENTELYNDIKYLSNQKEYINKIKQDILDIHNNTLKNIMNLYNTICIFDNNYSYILDKLYNKLSNEIVNYTNTIILLDYEEPIKTILENIINELKKEYTMEYQDKKKIKLENKNNKIEIKILKSSINIILNSGVEIKNINMNNWNIIKNLL